MEDCNKRVIKNTIYLYIRQVVILFLGLLSTKIVLNKLGAEDYGIYAVVGSLVSLFAVLNNVLQSSTRRFLSLGIGVNNAEQKHNTFQTALILHICVSLIVFVILESVGLLLLNYKLNIDVSRMWAANVIFQFSVLSVIVNILNTPFLAVVTSHERFDIYSYLSIFDVGWKIVTLLLLVYLPFDKLIIYALLTCVVTISGVCLCVLYCRTQFEETRHLSMNIDKTMLKEMLNFSAWDSFGSMSNILNVQGVTIIVNLFFGTVVNAARGLANTVTFTVSQFVGASIVAVEPQLVKSYACGEYDRITTLIFNISQMTLFMLAIFAVPIWLEIEFVLNLWLGGNVPEYTAVFIKITILNCFVSYSNLMVVKSIVATGNVKILNLRLAPIELSILPVIYVAAKMLGTPVVAYVFTIFPSFLKFMVNNLLLHRIINFPYLKYIINVFVKNIFLVSVAMVFPFIIRERMNDGWFRFIIVCGVSVMSTSVIMWCFSLNRQTRRLVLAKCGLTKSV
ncbi:MAG: oligosaccharide flippase family protein [Bacteroidaceae bacterium]|nr:oligosaccharide flippase family protein [Bacteroidaceae bacterium]